MSASINVAVIGYGRMGQIYAHAVATQVDGAHLFAVAEPTAAIRDDIQRSYDVTHVAADAREIIAHPGVHAIIIATPTSSHSELVVAAAEAGKAIFCEKPLALTLEESHAALRAVERAGVLLQIGFMRRFDAGYQRARRMIEEGQIGQPVTFKSIGRDPFCPRPDYADPAHSGGLIIDMGIHDLDLARWLVGSEVDRVSAEGTLMVCDTIRAVGDIDNAVINLRFESGALGNVELSRNAFYGYDIRSEVLGSEGAVQVGYYQQTPVLLLTREGAQHDVVPYLMERFGDAYRAQIRQFVEAVRHDQQPLVTGQDGLAAFEICLAATRSYQLGRVLTLAEIRRG